MAASLLLNLDETITKEWSNERDHTAPTSLRALPPAWRRCGCCATMPHFAPKAKRVIYLFQSGGPSQIDLFDYKRLVSQLRDTELPDSIRMGSGSPA